MRFSDRVDAGRRLGAALTHLRGRDLVVLGLPRGGVPVAAEVAAALDAPLDVIVVRKLGTPGHEELGMGAIGEGGVRVLDESIIASVGATVDQIAAVEAAERVELDSRARRFRGDRPPTAVAGRTAVVVDDGIATGSTAIAALHVVRAAGASCTVLATPVGPFDVEARMRRHADEVVVLSTPRWFSAVGQFYANFDQTTDAEVVACLLAQPGRGPSSLA